MEKSTKLRIKYDFIFSKEKKTMWLKDMETGKLVFAVSCKSWKQCLFYQNLLRQFAVGELYEVHDDGK